MDSPLDNPMDTPMSNPTINWPTTGTRRNRYVVPDGIDGRTYGARRLRELVALLSAKVPDPADPVKRALILDAAHLTMLHEQLLDRTVAGERIDPDTVVRVSGALSRALKRLKT